MSYLYTEVVNLIFSRHILTSEKEKELLCSCSKVNLIWDVLCSYTVQTFSTAGTKYCRQSESNSLSK